MPRSLLLALLLLAATPAFSSLRPSIQATQPDALRLMDYILNGKGRGRTFARLAEWVDTFGPRLCGGPSHQAAIDALGARLSADGLQVHQEEVQVPHWERGKESVTMLEPREYEMALLGLGTSVGTAPGNVTAEVLVVASFDELKARAAKNETAGKVIVFNQQCNWTAKPVDCYGESVQYRVFGAAEAAKVGGLASLIRTVGRLSLYTPHTGMQTYSDGVPKIPTACITIEDVEMMQRMQDRGQKIVVSLYMEAKNLPEVSSHNLIADLPGSTYPEHKVLVSGHTDSWDVGQGAMDDGGGAAISWMALVFMKELGIVPKRTVRFVGWSCEEFGGIGGEQYFQRHKSNGSKYDIVLESDMGTFGAYGIKFSGSDAAYNVMTEVAQLLQPMNATQVLRGGGGEDVDEWAEVQVPSGSLANDNQNYFDFHHSRADILSSFMYTPEMLDRAAAVWAVTALGIANLDEQLPRNNATESAGLQ